MTIIKRVLFIIPTNHSGIDGITKNLAQYKEIPYGILSIIAYVKARTQVNVHFKILDMNLYGEPAENLIRQYLDEFQPDIVGVSGLFTSMFNQVREVSEIIKAIRPQALLVVGGNVSTNCHEELFKYNPYVDAACFSEGEIPILDLINAGDQKALLDSH